MGEFVKPSKAEQKLGVSRATLKKWAAEGLIRSIQPGGKGQRLYDVSSVTTLSKEGSEPVLEPSAIEPVKAIYARVSTRKQLPDLNIQIEALKQKYPDHVVYSDVASGLNFKRKGLLSLLQLAFAGRLQLVRIAYKDRLCRFAYDLIEYVFEKHGAKICVETLDQHAPEHELAEDVIAIITVFGARLYGSRSGRARREQAAKNKQNQAPDPGGGGVEGRSEGTEKETNAIQEEGELEWAAENVQSLDASDLGTGQGIEEMLLRCAPRLQQNGGVHKKRRKSKHDQVTK